MLLSETVSMRWNARNVQRYSDLGYKYTRIGDVFSVAVSDLPNFSQALVHVRCDYCGKEYTTKWAVYRKGLISEVNKDCCNGHMCTGAKSADVMYLKHGVRCSAYMQSTIDKRKETCLKKYGTENPFANQRIKEKISATNMKRYGVKCSQQNKTVRAKTEDTCMKRYGVKNYVELFSGKFIGENSPVWKGGAEVSRIERSTHEYIVWRDSVYKKDKYQCQKCGARNGNGKNVVLNAHHVLNWADNIEARYDVSNGITMCDKCHTRFHQIYGRRHTTLAQINSFLEDEKVC